jgi:hypothetical protein
LIIELGLFTRVHATSNFAESSPQEYENIPLQRLLLTTKTLSSPLKPRTGSSSTRDNGRCIALNCIQHPRPRSVHRSKATQLQTCSFSVNLETSFLFLHYSLYRHVPESRPPRPRILENHSFTPPFLSLLCPHLIYIIQSFGLHTTLPIQSHSTCTFRNGASTKSTTARWRARTCRPQTSHCS